jgi:hypothetical protein
MTPAKRKLCPRCKAEDRRAEMRKRTLLERLSRLEAKLRDGVNANSADADADRVSARFWKLEGVRVDALFEVHSLMSGLRGWCWKCRALSSDELQEALQNALKDKHDVREGSAS